MVAHVFRSSERPHCGGQAVDAASYEQLRSGPNQVVSVVAWMTEAGTRYIHQSGHPVYVVGCCAKDQAAI